MIISASRRTDIPAFYAEWFMNRIRAGYCVVPNPFNRTQASSISLKPEDVDVIVFWTRNPKPLLPFLPELDRRGFRYYFQYTLLNNPPELDPHVPRLESALRTFQELAGQIGPQKVIWRYDPIVFSLKTDAHFHLRSYRQIAGALQGSTLRSVISLVDSYRKTHKRMEEFTRQGMEILAYTEQPLPWFADLMRNLARIARDNGMEIVSCAEEIDLQPYGIRPGKCIDDEYIAQLFGLEVTHRKDKSQRKACGCVESRDIGMYDTCVSGCRYCYATSSFERARNNLRKHDPTSPFLINVRSG